MKINEVIIQEKLAPTSIEQQMQNAFAKALDPSKKSDVFTGDEIKVATYIGPNATDWNNTSYLKAKQLHKQGASEKEIWDKTRNVIDAAGNWRQEQSDHETKLKGKIPPKTKNLWDKVKALITANGTAGTTLDQVLDAPDLFRNYPKLRNVRVYMDPNKDKTDADSSYYHDNKIAIGTELTAKHRMHLHHEIQHWIDEREKYGTGTAKATIDFISKETGRPASAIYLGNQGEITAWDTGDRVDMDDKKRGENVPKVKGLEYGPEKNVIIKKGSEKYRPTSVLPGPKELVGVDYKIVDNPNKKPKATTDSPSLAKP